MSVIASFCLPKDGGVWEKGERGHIGDLTSLYFMYLYIYFTIFVSSPVKKDGHDHEMLDED